MEGNTQWFLGTSVPGISPVIQSCLLVWSLVLFCITPLPVPADLVFDSFEPVLPAVPLSFNQLPLLTHLWLALCSCRMAASHKLKLLLVFNTGTGVSFPNNSHMVLKTNYPESLLNDFSLICVCNKITLHFRPTTPIICLKNANQRYCQYYTFFSCHINHSH